MVIAHGVDGGRRSGDSEVAVDEVADGSPGGCPVQSCGAGDRSVSGVDFRPPLRPEAVGDLAEHDGGSDFLLRAVVGRRHPAVLEEDEELAALPSSPVMPRRWRHPSARLGAAVPKR